MPLLYLRNMPDRKYRVLKEYENDTFIENLISDQTKKIFEIDKERSKEYNKMVKQFDMLVLAILDKRCKNECVDSMDDLLEIAMPGYKMFL